MLHFKSLCKYALKQVLQIINLETSRNLFLYTKTYNILQISSKSLFHTFHPMFHFQVNTDHISQQLKKQKKGMFQMITLKFSFRSLRDNF